MIPGKFKQYWRKVTEYGEFKVKIPHKTKGYQVVIKTKFIYTVHFKLIQCCMSIISQTGKKNQVYEDYTIIKVYVSDITAVTQSKSY